MAGELVDFTDEGTVPKDLDTLAGILSISRQQLDLYISKGLPTDYVHSAINWLVSSEPAWAAEERSEEGYSDDDLARLRAAKQDSDAERLRIQNDRADEDSMSRDVITRTLVEQVLQLTAGLSRIPSELSSVVTGRSAESAKKMLQQSITAVNKAILTGSILADDSIETLIKELAAKIRGGRDE